MNLYNHILRQALPLVAVAAMAPALAQTGQQSCYPADIAAPALTGITVGVVDMTTFRDPAITRDFRTAFLKAASQPGQRVVLLTFAGLSRGQHLTRVLDATVEAAVTDEDTVANARIGPFKASQRCVQTRLKEHVGKLTATLDETLKASASPALERSEIIHALRTVVEDFGEGALRLMVLSDGWQHNKEISFYAGGKPRVINAETELKAVERLYHLGPLQVGGKPRTVAAKVLWWGLMMSDDPKFYANPKQLDELGAFWRAVLKQWGVADVQIGMTLNNPRL